MQHLEHARSPFPVLVTLTLLLPAAGSVRAEVGPDPEPEMVKGLAGYPRSTLEAILEISTRPDLVKTLYRDPDHFRGMAEEDVVDLESRSGPAMVAAVGELLGAPEVVEILATHVGVTTLMGRLYAKRPQAFHRLVDAIVARRNREKHGVDTAIEDEGMEEELSRLGDRKPEWAAKPVATTPEKLQHVLAHPQEYTRTLAWLLENAGGTPAGPAVEAWQHEAEAAHGTPAGATPQVFVENVVLNVTTGQTGTFVETPVAVQTVATQPAQYPALYPALVTYVEENPASETAAWYQAAVAAATVTAAAGTAQAVESAAVATTEAAGAVSQAAAATTEAAGAVTQAAAATTEAAGAVTQAAAATTEAAGAVSQAAAATTEAAGAVTQAAAATTEAAGAVTQAAAATTEAAGAVTQAAALGATTGIPGTPTELASSAGQALEGAGETVAARAGAGRSAAGEIRAARSGAGAGIRPRAAGDGQAGRLEPGFPGGRGPGDWLRSGPGEGRPGLRGGGPFGPGKGPGRPGAGAAASGRGRLPGGPGSDRMPRGGSSLADRLRGPGAAGAHRRPGAGAPAGPARRSPSPGASIRAGAASAARNPFASVRPPDPTSRKARQLSKGASAHKSSWGQMGGGKRPSSAGRHGGSRPGSGGRGGGGRRR